MTNSSEVTIQGAYPISGTLKIPSKADNQFPAVLIIQGTGKADRDGNIKNFKMNIYSDLADFIHSKGFVTLHYDKRGTYKSGGDYLEAGVYDLIDDAAACVDFLKNHPQVDKEKIVIFGHSEGALIAPAVNKKSPVSGLILLAGAAEPSKDLLPRQSEMAYKEMNHSKGFKGLLFRLLRAEQKARKQNEKIINKILMSDKAVMRVQGVRTNAKWLRETFSYNVCDYLKEVTCPVLAITGDKDIQVPPEHAEVIANMVKGDSEWYIIPNMNHILRKFEGTHTILGAMKEYKSQLHQPIDQELFNRLEDWLSRYQHVCNIFKEEKLNG
ncbi:alpha/beta hydrolase [Cytobacillus gottheilii]|uniref:alpha/beta hydrolase n=1 Tax=Cytobacillus gottheilii TaxID=859144 RepID=UPI0009BB9F3A|nr:alpha/beta hydrolase [Cytobacillus gottheilii]